MPAVLGDLVDVGLVSRDVAENHAAVLERLRHTFGAARAAFVAVEGDAVTIVQATPPGFGAPLPDASTVGRTIAGDVAIETPVPGLEGPLLTLALRPPDHRGLCLVLGRERSDPWSADELEALVELRPHLELVLAYGLLQHDIATARTAATETEATRQRFLAVLSHELRNPLAPILMWTSTLKRLRADDPEVQRASKAIEHAVALARRLIEDMVDVSRLERGKIELHREPFDLRGLAENAIQTHAEALQTAGLELTRTFPDERVPVDVDHARLLQVVGNLLSNAIKFTPRGGRVTVAVTAHDQRAELRVSDTGPGLPPEVTARPFKPFTQGPNAHGGLGVGLAVAQRLAELHGGTLAADAAPEGHATSLVLTLPMLR